MTGIFIYNKTEYLYINIYYNHQILTSDFNEMKQYKII